MHRYASWWGALPIRAPIRLVPAQHPRPNRMGVARHRRHRALMVFRRANPQRRLIAKGTNGSPYLVSSDIPPGAPERLPRSDETVLGSPARRLQSGTELLPFIPCLWSVVRHALAELRM